LDAANNEWNWFNASGLIKDGMINDSFSKSQTGWTCNNDQSQAVFTYNQGVILGALCQLFAAVGARELLDTAQGIADALINHPVGKQVGNTAKVGKVEGAYSVSGRSADGILTEYNDTDPNASVHNKQFKGIFMRNLGYLYKCRPLARYRAFILNNANFVLSHATDGVLFGGNWSGPFDQADFVRQSAGIDLLNAANVVPPQADYTSVRQFLLDSGVSFPTHLGVVLNGAGSLRSVMHT
jgi:predicted alpha-1,6-mannanase (GH76 family)